MRKFFTLFSIAPLLTVSPSLVAESDDPIDGYDETIYNTATEIPLIESVWEKVDDVAQYGRADWDNVIAMTHNVSAHEAKMIAESDPSISYFFHVKGDRMILCNYGGEGPKWRVFGHDDAVFFTGQPWWGSAEGLADGYIRCAS